MLLEPPYILIPIALGGSPGLPGDGTLTLPAAIPANAALVGVRVSLQGFFVDPGATVNVSMTNAIEIWIG
jgi:hypothetical protein